MLGAVFFWRQPGALLLCRRGVSSNARKRLRAYRAAQADPHSSASKLKKLRERCAQPSHDLLRYLAEQKVGKAMTTADRRQQWFDTMHKHAPLFLGQMKPRMNLWTAALSEQQLPLPRLPEVAVAGRSNSGKSTLLNYLCGRHSAKMKRMPGSTTEIVFWKIGQPAQLCLVDLPGYGYAVAPEERRLQWTEFTLWYVRSRRNLRRVLLLIDARHGLKPSDKEMIAYLERYGVPWQLVASKCDKVVPKELAKRLTVLQEDTKEYHKMAGPPIPVSALRRKGMHALRETLDSLKVVKEVVKEGIRRRVYDLLEQRRARRAERTRRKRARQAAKQAQQQQQQQQQQAEDEYVSSSTRGESEAESEGGAGWTGDTGTGPKAWEGGGAAVQDLHSMVEAADLSDAWQPPPTVAEQQSWRALDGRDVKRIEIFMQGLFPDLPAHEEEPEPEAEPLWTHDAAATTLQAPAAAFAPAPALASWSGHACGGASRVAAPEGPADSDSDEEVLPSATRVLRFDPLPRHARGAPRQQPPQLQEVEASLTSAGAVAARPGPGPRGAGATTSRLRRSWQAPTAGQDSVYGEDDFASPDDVASGLRRFAPPAPSEGTRGLLLAEARRRYEREWAMELEGIEEVRLRAEDGAGGAGGDGEGPSNSTARSSRSPLRPQPRQPQLQLQPQPQPQSRFTGRAAYIGKKGDKPIPKGRGQWRILGRPPAKILKRRQEADAAKTLRLGKARRQRRNLGSHLSWEEAKGKWVNWYHRNKKKRFERIQMAASPQKEDVEAAFEERQRRNSRQDMNKGPPRWPRSDGNKPEAEG